MLLLIYPQWRSICFDNYPINKLGLKRLEKIIHKAEDNKVQIAFENLENIDNLDMVLNTFQSSYVGFCYDSCHHQNYAPDIDLLNKYGNQLMALHLHDNGGKYNQHQLPFDGNIDWRGYDEKDNFYRISRRNNTGAYELGL